MWLRRKPRTTWRYSSPTVAVVEVGVDLGTEVAGDLHAQALVFGHAVEGVLVGDSLVDEDREPAEPERSGIGGPEVEHLLARDLDRRAGCSGKSRLTQAPAETISRSATISCESVTITGRGPSRSIRRTGVFSSTRVFSPPCDRASSTCRPTALAAASMPASGSKTASWVAGTAKAGLIRFHSAPVIRL